MNITKKLIASVIGTGAIAAASLVGVSAAHADNAPVKVSGTGTVAVSITSPKAWSGSGSTEMNCASSGTAKTYVVNVKRVKVAGVEMSATAVVRNYTGLGTYNATVAVSLVKDGTRVAGTIKNVRVTVTATGGTADFSKTFDGGRAPRLQGTTVAGTLTWTCPTA